MRKIVVSNMNSLDSFYAGPNGEIDWFVTGDDFFEDMPDVYERFGTHLYGRVTYEGMLSFWTTPDAISTMPEIAAFMNESPKVVFSCTLVEATWGEWDNARLAEGEIGEAVRNLKAEAGKGIIIYGSGTIVSQLTQLGLIDEYWMFITPVILGSGKPEFSGITRQVKLMLTGVKALESGTVRLSYVPN